MINKVNLLRLADILDAAHAEHIKHTPGMGYDQRNFLHTCGAPACALGHWAAANPETWGVQELIENDVIYHRRLTRVGAMSHLVGRQFFGAWHDFGLKEYEGAAEELFGSRGCGGAQTAADAARYIRAFVARNGHGQS